MKDLVFFKYDNPLNCDSVFDSVLPPVPLGWKNWSLRNVWVNMTARLSHRQVSDVDDVTIKIQKTFYVTFIYIKNTLKNNLKP